METPKTLLAQSDVAEMLQLTSAQVGRMARRGQIPTVLLPGDEVRFDPDEVRAWIESRKQPPRQEAVHA